MFKNVTLEMSLKPFKSTDENYMRGVIEHLFKQWSILCDGADEVSVLLWTADGSEILDWQGKLDDEMEWCRYVGGAQRIGAKDTKNDPEGTALHSRHYLYMNNPPKITFGTLKKIVALIKEIGAKTFPDKRIRVGETFDPGPEFAVSDFKYKRHNECCAGGSMGVKSMVCCYSTLHADNVSYAGFPDGIPEGLPFGTFLGRQSQMFLTEMGFDYLWLSNGLGFGMETWSTTGAIFDGENFDISRFDEVKEKILGFWKLFRAECPDFRIETRGTNLSVGIDIATDGVPLKDIYNGNFNMLPPPNSPWAALDSNFGLEISGYLSRICELPKDEGYLFRYYVHDPWWASTPWIDRYDSLPHDIYMPMSVCRLDEKGEVTLPTNLNILSVDNSFGEMPDFCAHEPSVHINKAQRFAPDEPSPVVWVYPFDEYHSHRDEESIREMFFADWFICEAINHGFPIGSVVSTGNFVNGLSSNDRLYKGSVLVSTVPDADSEYEKAILGFVKNGGKVIFYGSVTKASERFKDMAGVSVLDDELYGEMPIDVCEQLDTLKHGEHSSVINHRRVPSGSGINTKLSGKNSNTEPLVSVGGRVCGTHSGSMVWLRGTSCTQFIAGRGHLLVPDSEDKYYSGESLMRLALDRLGWHIRFEKEYATSAEPVIIISRHDKAYMFANHLKDTTVKTKLKMPLGAPVMSDGETKIDSDGYAEYNFDKAEFRECRVFVQQGEGVVGCHNITPCSFFWKRRIKVTGLNNATVRFVMPKYCENNIEAVLNGTSPAYAVGDAFDGEYVSGENETYYEARNVTGTMVLAVPFEVSK